MDAYMKGDRIVYVSTNGNENNQSRIELGYIDCSCPCSLIATNCLIGADPASSYSFPLISWMNTDDGEVTVVQYCGSSSNSFPAVYFTLCRENGSSLECSKEYLLNRSKGNLNGGFENRKHQKKNIKLYRWGRLYDSCE